MLDEAATFARELIAKGGWVMYPLLALSFIAVTLIVERAWFWIATNHPRRLAKFNDVGKLMRAGQADAAMKLIGDDQSIYGKVARQMLTEAATEPVATAAIEAQRPRFERFMPTLGTIITAAPMLGILGTVTGVMAASDQLGANADPYKVFEAIGVALITTMVGLVIALLVLFPYNIFRTQMDRTLGRLDTLTASARYEEARK